MFDRIFSVASCWLKKIKGHYKVLFFTIRCWLSFTDFFLPIFCKRFRFPWAPPQVPAFCGCDCKFATGFIEELNLNLDENNWKWGLELLPPLATNLILCKTLQMILEIGIENNVSSTMKSSNKKTHLQRSYSMWRLFWEMARADLKWSENSTVYYFRLLFFLTFIVHVCYIHESIRFLSMKLPCQLFYSLIESVLNAKIRTNATRVCLMHFMILRGVGPSKTFSLKWAWDLDQGG